MRPAQRNNVRIVQVMPPNNMENWEYALSKNGLYWDGGAWSPLKAQTWIFSGYAMDYLWAMPEEETV